jgi:hypothetical protein
MGSPELALWTTVRHINQLAAGHAVSDPELYRAYQRVIAHAQERVEHYLRVASNTARPCPPTSPAPKSA